MKIIDETGAIMENPDLTLGLSGGRHRASWSTLPWKAWRK